MRLFSWCYAAGCIISCALLGAPTISQTLGGKKAISEWAELSNNRGRLSMMQPKTRTIVAQRLKAALVSLGDEYRFKESQGSYRLQNDPTILRLRPVETIHIQNDATVHPSTFVMVLIPGNRETTRVRLPLRLLAAHIAANSINSPLLSTKICALLRKIQRCMDHINQRSRMTPR